MKNWLARNRLDRVAGFCDSIITALVLAGRSTFQGGASLEAGLAVRLAIAATVSGAFVFLVAP